MILSLSVSQSISLLLSTNLYLQLSIASNVLQTDSYQISVDKDKDRFSRGKHLMKMEFNCLLFHEAEFLKRGVSPWKQTPIIYSSTPDAV